VYESFSGFRYQYVRDSNFGNDIDTSYEICSNPDINELPLIKYMCPPRVIQKPILKSHLLPQTKGPLMTLDRLMGYKLVLRFLVHHEEVPRC